MIVPPNLEQYARRRRLTIGEMLGEGVHGSVFVAKDQDRAYLAAIKSHRSESDYRRERDVYLRLLDYGVIAMRGCRVPQLIEFDDELLILEMTIVSRPFVLDFAGAFLDWDPGFSEDVLAEWTAKCVEEFGPHWPTVQLILADLREMGIFLVDIHPRNISFPD